MSENLNNKAKYFLLVWSQIGWFGCVYAEKFGIAWTSLVFPLIAWITLWKFQSPSLKLIFKLLVCAVVGIAFDATAIKLGQVTVTSETAFVPIWLISMWFLFVPILPHLAQIFGSKLWGTALVGFIAGPLTYKSGEAFEVLFIKDTAVLMQYGIFWALFFTIAVYYLRTPQVREPLKQ